jgi:hypothetical protein
MDKVGGVTRRVRCFESLYAIHHPARRPRLASFTSPVVAQSDIVRQATCAPDMLELKAGLVILARGQACIEGYASIAAM